MKIVTILGARPQFIKAAPVSKALANEGFEEIILHTGQHFDPNMSQIFFDEMGIPTPAYNLGIRASTHATMTGEMLIGIEKILMDTRPDMVLVFGDTNSTLAGSLAAKKLNIKVAHVEAGLRSFNRNMPEEINRIATDHISDYLFCPSETAVKQLVTEGFSNQNVKNVGDVMYDALLQFSEIAHRESKILETLSLHSNEFILTTLHRQENTDSPTRMSELLKAIIELSAFCKMVIPVHPRTRNWFNELSVHKNIVLIDPVGYLDMLQLLKHSKMVLTDSGGLQKEAYFSKKYCITARDETEWVELVDNGFNRLCGANAHSIVGAFNEFQNRAFPKVMDFYGDGTASIQIALSLKQNNHLI